MGATYGQKSSIQVSDNTLHIDISDTIVKYPAWQFPLLKRWSDKVFGKDVIKSHKIEWTEKEARPVVAKCANPDIAADATYFEVDTPGVFNVDDVLQKPNGEQMIVKQVNGGIGLVVQHWAGTPEVLALGDTVKRIGVASPRGKDADSMVVIGTNDLYNYTQIFEDVVDLDGGDREGLIHGEEGSGKLIDEKQQELMEMLQASLLVGIRNINKGEKRHTLGGLKFFIDQYAPNNAIDFGGAATWNSDDAVKAKLRAAVTKIAENNGRKPTIYMGWKVMDRFAQIENEQIRSTKTDKTRGVGVVDTFRSLLGDLDVVLVRERLGLLDNLMFLVDEGAIGYKARKNRAWFTEELAKVGDSYKWQVLGEYSMKVETPKVHSYIYNFGL